ncbi:MAG TPA: hypothetical protein ENI17_05545 [Pseudomonas xinjiangensis]|uniref:Uncharacterized protein n=2 Tax=root TaxID=1 RepID=A0A7V1BLP4_9GAMM|nr:hypothetical protein [Halopseudomonas xinjiangensis]HEC47078.1 hypothetical protein [Halopseudomonas xinjiangensis]
MQLASNPFEWLGEVLGSIVRIIIDSLAWIFDVLSGASAAFINGFARTLGVDSSWLSIAAVILGLLLIYTGVRALIRKHFIAGVLWLLLGLWLLSALVR